MSFPETGEDDGPFLIDKLEFIGHFKLRGDDKILCFRKSCHLPIRGARVHVYRRKGGGRALICYCEGCGDYVHHRMSREYDQRRRAREEFRRSGGILYDRDGKVVRD